MPEINNTGSISRHMMDILRNMLIRLRPAEVDDLGLNASLEKLVASWNNRANGQTIYTLTFSGDTNSLPESLPVNVYRMVQKCLTNIAKHANTHNALVSVQQLNQQILLDITDDGIALTSDFDRPSGVDLLGIRERVSALGGQLNLESHQKGGLTVSIVIPFTPEDCHE